MRRLGALTAFLSLAVFVAGCGREAVDSADVGPAAGADAKPNPPKGEPEPPDPNFRDPFVEDFRNLGKWLRSDYVKNLDPKKLRRAEDQGLRPLGPETFEESVDRGDLIVSGRVEGDLVFGPQATLTTFRVDRTAKGTPKNSIYLLQTSYVEPDGGEYRKFDNAVFVFDKTVSMLFEGDRAVLILRKVEFTPEHAEFFGPLVGDAPVYQVLRAAGQYRSEGGKVKAEEASSEVRARDRRFDGKTESELMAAGEARAKSGPPTGAP